VSPINVCHNRVISGNAKDVKDDDVIFGSCQETSETPATAHFDNITPVLTSTRQQLPTLQRKQKFPCQTNNVFRLGFSAGDF